MVDERTSKITTTKIGKRQAIARCAGFLRRSLRECPLSNYHSQCAIIMLLVLPTMIQQCVSRLCQFILFKGLTQNSLL